MIGRSLPGDVLAFSPPLIITEAEVTEMLDRAERALADLTVELRRERIAAVLSGMPATLTLSTDRLWRSLMEMAEIGRTPGGGCNRQTLTDLDSVGRRLLQSWGEAIGLTLVVDRVGNMRLHRPGRDPRRPAVAIGSHLDTQPTGGKFDGPLGVLAGLEIMRALHDAGAETDAPLVPVNWTNEEGARFSPAMMGSGVAMGLDGEADILASTDAAGATFGTELTRIGWAGTAKPSDMQRLGAYFELHIEQGPTLERDGLKIGVVTPRSDQAWLDVTVTGRDAHAGSAMSGRTDALAAAATLISKSKGLPSRMVDEEPSED